ncbi:hypothetical protein AX17_004903 [Amanita inopinata Kibby_2008]|nr:hypothetical protein AX17_004903 [Amanita inopinata Kibby_2008]
MSNSSNSPPLPSTPPPRPSRFTTRYADLGRVPLHRRGTSQTYERLEDLLREAGYKETRIFTPEGEHEEGTYHEHDSPSVGRSSDKKGTVRDGVGAVMDFLTGLLPSNKTPASSAMPQQENIPEQHSVTSDEGMEPLPPPVRPYTPSASSKMQRQLNTSGRSTPWTTRSSVEGLNELRRVESPTRSGTPTIRSPEITHVQSPYHPQHYPQRPQHQLVHRIAGHPGPAQNSQYGLSHESLSRKSSLQIINELPQQSPHPTIPLAHPHPSRATAYLRRMASRDMPARPNSTPVHPQPRVYLNDSDAEITGITGGRGDGEGEEDHRRPPLPRSWLETVARAVLFGGPSTYFGGPSQRQPMLSLPHSSSTSTPRQDPRMTIKGKVHSLRPTRSSLSQVSSYSQLNSKRSRPHRPHTLRTSLTDRTNMSRTTLSIKSSSDALAPPELFLRIERGRAGYSESQVTHTRVYCKSAPTSRGASAVRAKEKGFLKGQGRRRAGGGVGRGKRAERDRVPSLARTKAEGDMWARPKKRKTEVDDVRERHLCGCGAACHHRSSPGLGDGRRYQHTHAEYGYGSDADYGHAYGDEHSLSSEEEGEVDDDEDDEDEDEGELDLARLLVPPKRQNSIISLRKHLAVTMTMSTTGVSSRPGPSGGEGEIGGGAGFAGSGGPGPSAAAALNKVASSTMRIRGGYALGYGSTDRKRNAASTWGPTTAGARRRQLNSASIEWEEGGRGKVATWGFGTARH